MTSNSTDIQYAPYTTSNSITIGTSNIATSTICISTSSLPNSVICGYSEPYEKREYKCVYCETVHDHRTGKCENCGAPLGEAIEI